MRQKGIAHLFLLVIVVIGAIGAIGYLAYQNAQMEKQAEGTVATPENTDTQTSPTTTISNLTPPLDSTADWKTYTDDVLDYSIKYPSTYKFMGKSPDQNYIVIMKPGGEVEGTGAFSHFKIAILPATYNESIDETITQDQEDLRTYGRNDVKFTSTQTYPIGNLTSYSYYHSGPVGYQQQIFVSNNIDTTLHISIAYASEDVQQVEQSEVDQVVSTFRFID